MYNNNTRTIELDITKRKKPNKLARVNNFTGSSYLKYAKPAYLAQINSIR